MKRSGAKAEERLTGGERFLPVSFDKVEGRAGRGLRWAARRRGHQLNAHREGGLTFYKFSKIWPPRGVSHFENWLCAQGEERGASSLLGLLSLRPRAKKRNPQLIQTKPEAPKNFAEHRLFRETSCRFCIGKKKPISELLKGWGNGRKEWLKKHPP